MWSLPEILELFLCQFADLCVRRQGEVPNSVRGLPIDNRCRNARVRCLDQKITDASSFKHCHDCLYHLRLPRPSFAIQNHSERWWVSSSQCLVQMPHDDFVGTSLIHFQITELCSRKGYLRHAFLRGDLCSISWCLLINHQSRDSALILAATLPVLIIVLL